MPQGSNQQMASGFMAGLGQALPIVMVSGIGALLTLTVNVQVQLAEVRKDQQQLLMMVEQRRQDVDDLEAQMRELDRRVTTLEAR